MCPRALALRARPYGTDLAEPFGSPPSDREIVAFAVGTINVGVRLRRGGVCAADVGSVSGVGRTGGGTMTRRLVGRQLQRGHDITQRGRRRRRQQLPPRVQTDRRGFLRGQRV